MIFDHKTRVIGKIVNIDTHRCSIMLTENIENFLVNGFDDIHRFAQINSYVIIPFQNEKILAEVIGIKERNSLEKESESIKKTVNTVNTIEVVLLGKLIKEKEDWKFKYGISVYPPLYSDVLYVTDEELNSIFQEKKEQEDGIHNTLDVGLSTVFPDYSVHADINSLFGKHSAVLGNTGSGKSCTISAILQGVFKKNSNSAKGASFIIFDTNGEYLKAFSDLGNEEIKVKYLSPDVKDVEEADGKYKDNDNVLIEKFELPYWFLNFDEWALLLQASEKVQIPVLRTGISFSQEISSQRKQHIGATLIKNTIGGESAAATIQKCLIYIDKYEFPIKLQKCEGNSKKSTDNLIFYYNNYSTLSETELFLEKVSNYITDDFKPNPVNKNKYFNIDCLESSIEDAISYEEAHGNGNIRSFCSPLLTRIKDIISKEELKFLQSSSEKVSQKELICKYLGLVEKNKELIKKEQIIIIDLSSTQEEGADIITSVVSRMIFDELLKLKERNTFPVNFIIEEAHRYIAEHSDKKFNAQKIFERIAKEGRKFGLSLMVSSQRPSELSKTVLSQCSNFIVHRIMNPEDLRYIGNVAPYISKPVLDQLPYIQTQHALMFGDAINIPMMFKVKTAYPLPRSGNNEIAKNWFCSDEIDFSSKFSFQNAGIAENIKEDVIDAIEKTEAEEVVKKEPSKILAQIDGIFDAPELNYESEIKPEDLPF